MNIYNTVVFQSSSSAMPQRNHTLEEENIQGEMNYVQPTGLPRPGLSPKLLHRFYEPLGLLFALGKARGEHTHKTLPSFEQADSLTTQQLRRQFLDELAFLCDYKKGGNSCTAIALGETPQRFIFWVAANKCPEKRIVPFLEELLKILKGAVGSGDDQVPTGDIFRISVTFAHARIKTYARYLLLNLEKLKEFPACTDEPISGFITDWENQLENLVEDPHSLVEFAYENRHSKFMHQLATLAHERRYKLSRDSLQATCASARHNIGRLGLHARSAKALAAYAPRMIEFLDSYRVQAVPVPIEGNGRPPPRKSTNIEAALKRMLRTDAEFEVYRQALALMDKPFKISERFLNDYSNSKNKTRVHAEVQVLHHFDQHDKEFAEGDKYIACSKPACFCCHLYFRHHPGKFVEPRSHHKIYLNWQPPDKTTTKAGKENQLRDILNHMIVDIRKDALGQIIKKAAPRGIHPDSITGVSLSSLAAPELGAISVTAHDERENDALSDVGSEYSNFESDNTTASSSSVALPGMDDDTDEEEGGISLLGIEEAFV